MYLRFIIPRITPWQKSKGYSRKGQAASQKSACGLLGDFFRLSLCSTMLSLFLDCYECTVNALSAACRSDCFAARRFRCLRGLGRTLGLKMAFFRLDPSADCYLGSGR